MTLKGNFPGFFFLSMILICPIMALEALAPLLTRGISPLGATALIRTFEIIFSLTVLNNVSKGFFRVGMSTINLSKGLRTGITWSMFFGLTVFLLAAIMLLNDLNLLKIVGSKIPFKGAELYLFFLTGGLIAPIAEEIVFRGVLYSLFRELNCAVAIIFSTLIFALFHYRTGNIPLFQIIGGVVFALSFEFSKSLAAPIIIHALGNLAIFSISLYLYQ